MLLTDLLLMAASACLLTILRATSPGVAPPAVGWALPHYLLRKFTTGQYSRGILFAVEVPSSQMTLDCVKLA